ncbi:hypothetical protein Pla22_01100 [Rubripirellula amarantea]|uniref:Uncharacterized protein n=2 Tax=Rubripirellula amarantea TaxID=2527999 RepID=A0A5C5WNT4_9BACT|nr:hypothetical protein Pla22_01100 [Rubripirellula amarantea]
MIDTPQTKVTVSPAESWSIDTQFSSRAVPIAQRVARIAGSKDLPNCRVTVQNDTSRKHQGLGSGTQLSLSIAEGLCQFANLDVSQEQLAVQIADRGKRSAVGVHGYFQGGLIHEEPTDGRSLNPVVNRIPLPPQWRVAFYLPPTPNDPVSGTIESDMFAKLPDADERHICELQNCLSQNLIPSASRGDFEGFTTAVTTYNRLSGMLFAEVQGGAYNGENVTTLVKKLQQHGAVGVGQSSWGPGVFAWFESAASLTDFHLDIDSELRPSFVASVMNQGRH